MALRDELEDSGNWLFRWRSYLPLLLFAPMLIAMRRFTWPLHNQNLHEYWEFACLMVSFLGLAIRCKVVGHAPDKTSGRNTSRQIAEKLNTTGMYSVVRHPLYLGNFLMWLGIAMFCLNFWLVTIFALTFWLYYERIMMAEESFLRRSFGEEFESWAAQTPAFLPRLKGYRKPELSFCLRNVLRREYGGLLGIAVVFLLLEVLEHLVVEGKLVFEPFYVGLVGVSFIAFLLLRTLKRATNLLHVDGR